MKYLILLSFLLFSSSDDTSVYICTGPKSECYHNKRDCRGLKNYSDEIKTVTLEKAKQIV